MYKDTLQKVKRFMTETGMLQNCSEIILVFLAVRIR